MEKIHWGIIGCGDVTEKKSGPAFNKVNHSKLVAVMRRDAQKARDYAQRHQVPKWYSDVNSLIRDEEVNAIYIATPPAFHEEYTLLALQAGKPVYVEKPMATNLQAAENMFAASVKNKVKLSVAHYRRQQKMFKTIKSLIETRAIGEIRLVNITLLQSLQAGLVSQSGFSWRIDPAISGGGLFHDLAPHQLDLMIYFFGKPMQRAGLSLNQARHYNADDLVAGFIEFEHGVVVNGSWCFSVSPDDESDKCVIIGSEGIIRFSVFRQPEVTLIRKGKTEQLHFETLEHVQQPMIDTVVKYFRNEGPNPCSAEDGVETMRLIEDFTGKREM